MDITTHHDVVSKLQELIVNTDYSLKFPDSLEGCYFLVPSLTSEYRMMLRVEYKFSEYYHNSHVVEVIIYFGYSTNKKSRRIKIEQLSKEILVKKINELTELSEERFNNE